MADLILGGRQTLLGPLALRDVANIALDEGVAVVRVTVTHELHLPRLASFGFERQILVADKALRLQFQKSRLVGSFVAQQADFPKLLAHKLPAGVAEELD